MRGKLKKELGLFDVYAVSTGAMFSSGFFLLPGLAAAKAGPAVGLAYLLAGVLIMPAMLSVAELTTAMPKSGGAYYFITRALGPAAGTVGGLGTYIALTLKTVFALVGIGAYASLFIDFDVETVAVVLTVFFAVLNIVGAKETTRLQRFLVSILVGVLLLFLFEGARSVVHLDYGQVID
ncbi:MAG: amino acid permease, partial [Bacteroidota bacterium]